MIYVDDHYKYASGRYGRLKMSHLIADTDEELERMARKLKLKKEWKHNEHYDIALSKRKLAIAHGARPISLRICAIMVAYKRRTGKLPKPDKAVEAMQRLVEDEKLAE